MSSPLRVVYIMGYGRSGSTLLDTLLGEVAGVLSTGEFHEFGRVLREPEARCACGTPVPECPFWLEVLQVWTARGWRLEEYAALQARLARFGLRTLLSQTSRRWMAMTVDLFQVVAGVSGASTVVDSSKLPHRGRALARSAGLDVFLVHLVRDGRGVAWSLSKRHAKDPAAGVERDLPARSVSRTALRWSAVNLQARRALAAHPPDRQCVLRYEDYTREPALALAPLRPFLEPGSTPAGQVDEPAARHMLAGNRLRMSPAPKIHTDSEWQTAMAPGDRKRFWLIAGPVLRSFGYVK